MKNKSRRLGQGLKGKRRLPPVRHAEAKETAAPRRNDMLPLLKIEVCAVDALKSYARKLRKSDSVHVREIANSISALGFNVPLLIGKDNVVVDGDSRLEAARLLGLSSVPCIRVDHLDQTEQRLLRLAVNRLGEKGVWDVGELEAEFSELIIADAPIEISGFGPDEFNPPRIGEDADGDADPAPLPEAAITRVGDLFRLGPHLVICGDATDPAVVRRLMRGEVARMVLTDQPFHIPDGDQMTGVEPREWGRASLEITEAQFLDFNGKWMEAVLPDLVDGGILGTLIEWRALPLIYAAATALGLHALDLVVWAKSNAGPGGLYPSQHGLLPLFKKGAAAPLNNISPGKRRRHRTNLWTYPAASSSNQAPEKRYKTSRRRNQPPCCRMRWSTSRIPAKLFSTPFSARGPCLLRPRIPDDCAAASSSIPAMSTSSSGATRRKPALALRLPTPARVLTSWRHEGDERRLASR
jgi:ParB-like nuclease family protein